MNNEMTYQIEYLPSALQDLKEIAYYTGFKLQNPEAAENLSEKIVSTVEKLAEKPYRYPVYYPMKQLEREYRKITEQNYLIFYWVDEDKHLVTVAKVIYCNKQVGHKATGFMSAAKMKSVLIGSVLSVAAVAVAISAAVHFTNYDNRQLTSFSDTVSSNVSDNREQHIVDTVTRSKVFDDSFRSELTEAEQVVYDAMVQHYVVERKSNEERFYIDAAAMGVEQPGFLGIGATMKHVSDAFLMDYPEIVWATYQTFDVKYDENHEIESVSPRFDEWWAKYSDAETIFRGIDEAEAAIREARTSESRYDTVKAIHDYLCRTVDYDTKTYHNGNFDDIVDEAFTCTPAFGGGSRPYKLVCEGYAKAFKVLCNRLDVPCIYSGDEVLDHAFNYVLMDDGLWYGVDVTWDDIENGNPVYTYFLFGKNTSAIQGNHTFIEIASTASGVYDTNEPFFYNPMQIADEQYRR